MVVRIPSGLFFELLKYARENHISTSQLALEFIRLGLAEKRGWQCPHLDTDRKFSRKTKQWYCVNCYTFFDKVADRTIKGGFRDVPRLPVWEIKKEMTTEEWSKQIKPDNQDLK